MTTLLRALVVAVIVAGGLPSVAAAQDEIVERGNLAYQDGDFPAAIEAYEAVIDGGFTSAGLEYNLGNAYFKTGDLGRAILHWERALARSPGDPDTRANLELARSLTADAIEPLPTFWAFSAASWWVDLLPRRLLLLVVGLGWSILCGGTALRILARSDVGSAVGRWTAVTGLTLLLLFGPALVVREFDVGRAEHGIVLVDAIPVRSAPAADDDLTLFEIHEGTRVRIDQRTGQWIEVVLDDGKVGWMPADAIEII